MTRTIRRILYALPLLLAAGAADHLLPTGLGASAVDLRFMTVRGMSLTRSSAALALYPLAESVGRIALLGAVPAVAAGVLTLVRRVRAAVFSFLRTAPGEARSVRTRPSRAPAPWGGAFAFPALRVSSLVLVGRALGLSVPVAHMAVAHPAATVALALMAAMAVAPAFRVLTVWLPMLPGALALGVLVRLKVIRPASRYVPADSGVVRTPLPDTAR